MIKKLAFISLLTSVGLYADIAGGEISVGMFSHSPSGHASYSEPYTGLGAGTSADLEETLHWKSNENMFLKAYIEHPVPLFPNVKFGYTQLSQEGEGEVGNDFVWGSIHIPTLGNITNSFDTRKYDVTLYYELLDNWIEADAGITLGYIDGNINLTALSGFNPLSSHTESTDFSLLIPTLYGKTRFNIPNTNLSLQFEGDIISYSDTTFYNYELSARYTFSIGLGIEAGYKALHLESDDLADGLTVNMDFNGPYAALLWDF